MQVTDSNIVRVALALALVLFGASASRAQQDELSPIEQRVLRLNSSRFETRMDATRSLIEDGEAAIEPLMAALQNKPNNEVKQRALEVLEQLAKSEMKLHGGAAHMALRQLAEGPVDSLSRESLARLSRIKVHRGTQALEQLIAAGAEVKQGLFQPLGGGGVRTGIQEIVIGSKWKGTEDDIQWLAYLSDVAKVVFDGRHTTNAYIKPVVELKSVFELEIKRASIDKDAIAMLATLEQCDVLSIYHTPISDDSVESLGKVPSRMLRVYGTKITEEGRKSLEAALAGVSTLDFRAGGGFLGVGPRIGDPPNLKGFYVDRIEPNSAAQRAGLRSGDLIIKYDGKVVAQFEQIRELIAKNAPGDKVKVEYIRGGKQLETTVTLGEWR